MIATGDLVNNGKNTFEFENYVRAMAGFRMPLFNVPGNHDAKGSMPHYHRYLGPDHYSFNVGDGHFVMLNCLNFDEAAEGVGGEGPGRGAQGSGADFRAAFPADPAAGGIPGGSWARRRCSAGIGTATGSRRGWACWT